MSGILSVHRVTADSAGTSATQADGSPTQIAALSRYLDAGESHTCVVLNGGELKCFGSNTAGQIGSGGTVTLGDATAEMGDALVAVNLGAGRTVRSVSAGTVHTCALLDNGTVKCFGEGDNGRLGYGSSSDIGRTAAAMGDALPSVDLGAGRTATLLATGAAHTCVVLDNGDVKCWGLNDDGQLGVGDTVARGDAAGEMGDALPAVSLGLASGLRVTGIAAGDAHTCALISDGSVKCWGSGANGRLGTGDENSRGDEAGEMGSSLAVVDLGSGRRATALSAGGAHTCAIRDTNDVVCWGVGATGRLGSGGEDNIGDEAGEMGAGLIPVSLGSGRTAIGISAGRIHTCAMLDSAEVKCWGGGANGRLGSGAQDNLGDQPGELGDSLAAIALGAGRTVRAVVASSAHTCVVLDTFALKCFGLGTSGRLGSGGTTTLGDAAAEMGDNLLAVNLGTDRRVMSLTEPGRAGTPTGTAGDGNVSLTWTAPASDGGAAISDYLVEYSTDGHSWTTFADGTSALTSATVTGLTNSISAHVGHGDGTHQLHQLPISCDCAKLGRRRRGVERECVGDTNDNHHDDNHDDCRTDDDHIDHDDSRTDDDHNRRTNHDNCRPDHDHNCRPDDAFAAHPTVCSADHFAQRGATPSGACVRAGTQHWRRRHVCWWRRRWSGQTPPRPCSGTSYRRVPAARQASAGCAHRGERGNHGRDPGGRNHVIPDGNSIAHCCP
ncbi:MAG: hypothetical protein RIR87_2 [Actinomycetota bacterium]